jgi:glycopeptide antibiotics resistance protein
MTALHQKPPQRDGRAGVSVLFGVYLALLVWSVIWKLGVPHIGGVLRTVKLVPFVAAGGNGASQPDEVVANLLLFMPFGVYLALLAPTWRWWRIGAVLAGSSAALEVTQFVLSVGSTDITDVIVNTAGGLAGAALLVAAGGRRSRRTAVVMGRICVAGTAAAVLVGVAIFASPLHHGLREVPDLPSDQRAHQLVSPG